MDRIAKRERLHACKEAVDKYFPNVEFTELEYRRIARCLEPLMIAYEEETE